MLKQLDIVHIVTTKNVRYVSGPPGAIPNPNQNWTVAGNIGTDLLLTAGGVVTRVPVSDVRKIADYNPEALLGEKDGQEKESGTD